MSKLSKLIDVLEIVANPGIWSRTSRTSETLTRYIEDKLDAGEQPVLVSDHTMSLGDLTLWRDNYPYAYGSIWGPKRVDVLPSRATALRLRRAEKLVRLPSETLVASVINEAGEVE